MKRPDPRPSDHEAVEATAAAWLAQRDEGFTSEQAAEFERWRAADPRHEAAAARLEGAWAALQQLRDFRPEARVHPDRDLLRPRGDARRRRMLAFPRVIGLAAAASLAFAAIIWVARGGFHAQPTLLRYATTADGYERVSLEDGSMLELNGNSEVAVRFTTAERRLQLVRGEAHFTVAKNKERPFRVEANGVAVRAVGTAFNVRLGPADIEVLVTEGTVEVAPAVEPAPAASRHERDARDLRPAVSAPTPVTANERVLISTASANIAPPRVEKVTTEVIHEALAWQGPRLVFVDTPLAEAITQFNRRNRVQMELADAELGALPIAGSFRAENVEAFVRLLVLGNDLVAERSDAGHVVLRKRK